MSSVACRKEFALSVPERFIDVLLVGDSISSSDMLVCIRDMVENDVEDSARGASSSFTADGDSLCECFGDKKPSIRLDTRPRPRIPVHPSLMLPESCATLCLVYFLSHTKPVPPTICRRLSGLGFHPHLRFLLLCTVSCTTSNINRCTSFPP
jgi:hypothetical protein